MAGLLQRIAAFAQARPEDLALAFVARGEPDVELSWRDLETAIRRLGRHFAESGVSPGEVVLVLSASPREQALGFLGALACGAVPTILSFPSVKQSEERFLETLEAVAESGRARWALASEELAPAAGQLAGVGMLRFPPPRRPHPDPLPSPPLPPGEGAPSLFLQFSSGTTGARKGVAVSSEMLAAQAESLSAVLELGPADRVANWLPLYHDNGLVGCFLLPLYLGAASIHLTPFEWVEDPLSLFRVVDRYRATLLWSPSFAFSFCARRIAPEDLEGLRLGSLRALISCGELTRESSFRRFLDRFAGTGLDERHLQVSYALAENTFALTQTIPGVPPKKDVVDRRAFFEEGRAVPAKRDAGMTFYSCGPVLPGQSVRITGAAEDRRVGEIEIRSDCLVAGYLSAVEGVWTEDGWYRSGDQGYLAEGELFCTGRLRDLVICRGFASLEEMAAAYVRELLALRPEGPYALGGWSLGGTVAFEMACQLEAQGREVAFLLLLDTFRPIGRFKRSWYAAGRIARRRVLRAIGAGRLFSLLQGGGHADPLGWQKYTLRPLESHELDVRGTEALPDPHLALMQDENVGLYAGDLAKALEDLSRPPR